MVNTPTLDIHENEEPTVVNKPTLVQIRETKPHPTNDAFDVVTAVGRGLDGPKTCVVPKHPDGSSMFIHEIDPQQDGGFFARYYGKGMEEKTQDALFIPVGYSTPNTFWESLQERSDAIEVRKIFDNHGVLVGEVDGVASQGILFPGKMINYTDGPRVEFLGTPPTADICLFKQSVEDMKRITDMLGIRLYD